MMDVLLSLKLSCTFGVVYKALPFIEMGSLNLVLKVIGIYTSYFYKTFDMLETLPSVYQHKYITVYSYHNLLCNLSLYMTVYSYHNFLCNVCLDLQCNVDLYFHSECNLWCTVYSHLENTDTSLNYANTLPFTETQTIPNLLTSPRTGSGSSFRNLANFFGGSRSHATPKGSGPLHDKENSEYRPYCFPPRLFMLSLLCAPRRNRVPTAQGKEGNAKTKSVRENTGYLEMLPKYREFGLLKL